MKRRDFLKAVGLGAASLAIGGCRNGSPAPTQVSGKSRPNFVFILLDDLGWKDLGFMGNGYHQTPNIDELAAEGVVFTNAYANAPNCAPTRASLMSGQYTPRHGIYTVDTSERGSANLRRLIPTPNKTELDTKRVTIAEALKPGGYTTGCIGKWHLGEREPFRPQDQGFDVVFDRSGGGHFTDDGRYLTDVLTEKAIQFIENNKGKPFFLYLAHHAVHVPLEAKPELVEKYKNKPPSGNHKNPTYAAMIESVDQSVAAILAKLDELNLRGNTVVFFFSDNGGYGNATSMEPLRGSKGMLYEGGIRVPLIIRWPGRTKAGLVCDAPVIGMDFYPTILDIAGLKKPEHHILDGQSIVPLLNPNGRDFKSACNRFQNRPIFWHFPAYLEPYNDSQRPWRTTPAGAVRKSHWKLIEFFEDGKIELYNLADDIDEKNDLAESLPEKAEELHKELISWRMTISAPVPTQLNPQFDAGALDAAGRARCVSPCAAAPIKPHIRFCP